VKRLLDHPALADILKLRPKKSRRDFGFWRSLAGLFHIDPMSHCTIAPGHEFHVPYHDRKFTGGKILGSFL
jgi:hypothetical protein